MSEPVWTVYKTTHIESGKFYFGVHKTRNPNDRYLGSGKHIKAAVRKHGRDAFKKEVVFVFDNPDDAYSKEADLANSAHVARSDTYNLIRGGTYSHSDRFGQSGELNSQQGTTWITREGSERKVHSSQVDSYLEVGWSRGRSPRVRELSSAASRGNRGLTGRAWVHKESEEQTVPREDLPGYLVEGWKEGRLPLKFSPERNAKISKSLSGRVWVHRGSEKLRVPSPEVPAYLSLGYARGMGKRF